jgi:small subunit ribosomal protein S6
MTVLAPDVPEDELIPAIETIETYITRYGGSIIAVNHDSPWGRRRLAYPIRYQSRDVRDGFYVLWYFDAEPESIAEIDREIRLNDTIIRHLTIALDKPFVPAPPAEEAPAETEASAPTAEPEAPAAASAEAAPEAAPAEVAQDAEAAPVAEADETVPAAAAEAEAATGDNVADEAPAAEPAAETAE